MEGLLGPLSSLLMPPPLFGGLGAPFGGLLGGGGGLFGGMHAGLASATSQLAAAIGGGGAFDLLPPLGGAKGGRGMGPLRMTMVVGHMGGPLGGGKPGGASPGGGAPDMFMKMLERAFEGEGSNGGAAQRPAGAAGLLGSLLGEMAADMQEMGRSGRGGALGPAPSVFDEEADRETVHVGRAIEDE
jgi:hypothetical protein